MASDSAKTTTDVLHDLRQMSGTNHVGQTAIHAADEIERLRSALEDIANERGRCGACGRISDRESPGWVCCDEDANNCRWDPMDPISYARKALNYGK